jgi:hypothetical protein
MKEADRFGLKFSHRILALIALSTLFANLLTADQIAVRHKEGLVHGFLVLRTVEGKLLADGDLLQNAQGDRVTSRLVFRFKDGSMHDETAVFSQRDRFRLLRYHLIQKGPAFEHPMEVTMDGLSGEVIVHYVEDGREKSVSEHIEFPLDVGNGLMLTLLKNVLPDTAETKLSFVVAVPKPQIVKLKIRPQGEEKFITGRDSRKAMHYVVKVEIGGLKGIFASLAGKEPPDTQVWILQGEAPAFVRSEGPLAPGGPVWRIELASPEWPRVSAAHSNEEK